MPLQPKSQFCVANRYRTKLFLKEFFLSALSFEIQARASNSRARRGVIHTAHGDIETPGFMAVATQATVKGLNGTGFVHPTCPTLDMQYLSSRPAPRR